MVSQIVYSDMEITVELRPTTATSSYIGVVAEEGNRSCTEDDGLRVHVTKSVLKCFRHWELILKSLEARKRKLQFLEQYNDLLENGLRKLN